MRPLLHIDLGASFRTILMALAAVSWVASGSSALAQQPSDAPSPSAAPAGSTAAAAQADEPQSAAPPVAEPQPLSAQAAPAQQADASEVEGPPAPGTTDVTAAQFWPQLEGPGLTWFAIIVILVLTFRLRPLFSERNLDGLVLAATCLLLALRTDQAHLPNWAAGQTGQWWSYVLLSVAAGYWLLRGFMCLGSAPLRRLPSNVAGGALLILLIAGLAIAANRIITSPMSPAARDGLVGGLYMADTGKLPYGQAEPHDRQSPLLYMLDAGAVKLLPPKYAGDEPGLTRMTWSNHDDWQDRTWWAEGEFPASRAVDGLLFVATVAALFVIGSRLHSRTIGLTLVTVFCVFPGATECLSRPDVMLATTLLAWTLALALIPGISGFFALLLAVLAGVAWPWAWLAIPVLLGYFFRSGLQAFASVAGLLGGVAGTVALLTWLTPPSIPRADGALLRAEQLPAYTVDLGQDGMLRVTKHEGDSPQIVHGWLQPFWKMLVQAESVKLDPTTTRDGERRVFVVDDIRTDSLLFRNMEPTETAAADLNARYRAQLASADFGTRVWTGLRTLLEQTWLAKEPLRPALPSVWDVWRGGRADQRWWPIVHKGVKIFAVVLAIVAGLALLRRKVARPMHLMGGLLAMSSAALLADASGAVTNLAWLMPTVLAVWAAGEESRAAASGEAYAHDVAAEHIAARLEAFGPAPRITVND
jgi:hypothetical protein